MENENNEAVDFKVGTKGEEFWTNVKERAEKAIEDLQGEIAVNEEIKKAAERKIDEEQRKKDV